MARTKKAAQRRKHFTRLRQWCRANGVSYEEAALNDDGPPPPVWYPNRRARTARDRANNSNDNKSSKSNNGNEGGDGGNGDGDGGNGGNGNPPPRATLSTASTTAKDSRPSDIERGNPRNRVQLPPLVVEMPRVPVVASAPAQTNPARAHFDPARKRALQKHAVGGRPQTRSAVAAKC